MQQQAMMQQGNMQQQAMTQPGNMQQQGSEQNMIQVPELYPNILSAQEVQYVIPQNIMPIKQDT